MTQHGNTSQGRVRKETGAAQLAQQAKALDALAQHQDSVPSTT